MSNLWLLTVRERSGGTTELLFRGEERASEAFNQVALDREIMVADDFGATALIRGPEVAAIWLHDMAQVAEGKAEVALFQARAQVKLQDRADADPMLMAAARKQQLAQARAAHAGMPIQWPPGMGRGS